MTTRHTLRGRREHGGTLVESALVFLLFFTILVGILDFGRLVWMYETLSQLASEGARYASCHGTASKNPAEAAAVRASILPYAIGLNPALLNVTLTWSPNNAPGSLANVQVAYAFTPMLPFIPSPSLVATSQMTVSW